MAVNKQLDQQGETAKKLYEKIADSTQNYNNRRKEQTKALHDALAPIWAALADGKAVNGQKDKLSWCKWANPAAKHPERYFYMVMQDKAGLKSLQSKPKKIVVLRNGLVLSAKGLSHSRSLPATTFEVVNVEKHGVGLKAFDAKQNIWMLEVRVRPVAEAAAKPTQKERIAVAKKFTHITDPATYGHVNQARTLCSLPVKPLETVTLHSDNKTRATCKECADRIDYAQKKLRESVEGMMKKHAAEKAKAAAA
jgi:hypothetical protein